MHLTGVVHELQVFKINFDIFFKINFIEVIYRLTGEHHSCF